MVLLFAIAISFSAAVNAQFVVKIRPGEPEMRVRPVAPSAMHVWVGGEWAVRDGRYAYTEGYWAKPPSRGNHWKEGHWRKTRRGWTWVPGHWGR